MRKVAVFCGASSGFKTIYKEKAIELGIYLATNNIAMVFGGGKIGMMGAIADAMLSKKGNVIGVIPHLLRHEEVEHDSVSKMYFSKNMSKRKIKISKMVDGYIALPGGFGTLDEIFEALTLGQLGIEVKPVGILNTEGFFDPLLLQLDKMVKEGFLRKENREMLLVSKSIPELIDAMYTYKAPIITKLVNTVGS
ncbi:MAG TPA: TIGR00730 family Rossman fold protein [Lutibacter sp.]|nr:TIGR00730 family Rossman fold protein [Lutibacter sp.]